MKYKPVECVGFGTYGKVYSGLEQDTGKVVALKAIDLEKCPEEIEELQKEVNMMKQLNLPSVVEYYTSYVRGSVLWIVMEFMDGGSLDKTIQIVPNVSEQFCATVLFDLLNGLVYLHKEGKIHRDLKCGNILISRSGKVKLSDFGVAGQLTQTKQARNTLVGSPYWTAPEVIAENNYNVKADIWSFGVTAIELAMGTPPNSRMHPMEALLQIPKIPPPRLDASFSAEFRDLVAVCCQRIPSSRPSASDLLSHPFFDRRIVDPDERSAQFGDVLDEKAAIKAEELARSSEGAITREAGDERSDFGSGRDLLGSRGDLFDSLSGGELLNVDYYITMKDFLAEKQKLPEKELKIVVKCLLLHLSSLHDRGTILKSMDPTRVKLSPCGCIKLATFEVDGSKVGGDALLYTAPEAIFDNLYTKESDIWSFGMLVYKLATGEDPFKASRNPILVMNAMRDSPPPQLDENEFSEDLCQLVSSCTSKSSAERRSVAELLRLEFVRIEALSGSSLLTYENLEGGIHTSWRSHHPDEEVNNADFDDEFLLYTDVRQEEKYISFMNSLDFSTGEGLDWDMLEEDLPEIVDYLSSDSFHKLLQRYQALVDEQGREPEDPTKIEWDF